MVEKTLAKNSKLVQPEQNVNWLYGGCYIQYKTRVRKGQGLNWYMITDAYTGDFVGEIWSQYFKIGMKTAKKMADDYVEYVTEEHTEDKEGRILKQGMLFGKDSD